MIIGYACTLANPIYGKMQTCRIKDVTEERLCEVIEHNLEVLKGMIQYNCDNHIFLFRISSDVIPFGSSDVNQIKWWDKYENQLVEIGRIAMEHHIRLSMHPGQYTVLNSPSNQVVQNAIADLEYHCRFLDSMKVDSTNKIVLHIGGVYQDREEAIKRFEKQYCQLSEKIKRRLVIENDDRSYSAGEVLGIAKKLEIPMIFDVFHHEVLASKEEWSLDQWIKEVCLTWAKEDGVPKIHYSQQAEGKRPGAHSETIDFLRFIDFCEEVKENQVDMMLEVKDKNISALKCILTAANNVKNQEVEKEWGRYKYLLLEHSHAHYLKARKCIKNKENAYVIELFSIFQEGLSMEPTVGGILNAGMHVWGYFKDQASPVEKKQYNKILEGVQTGDKSSDALKKFLWKLAVKYKEDYLRESYYFL